MARGPTADRAACRAANLFLAGALALLLLVPLALAVSPDGDGLLLPGGARLPSLCLVRHLTGRPCPTCALGRSIVLAVHGRVGASWDAHRGGLVVLAWVLVQALVRLRLAVAPPRAWQWRRDAALSAASLLLLWAATVALGWTGPAT